MILFLTTALAGDSAVLGWLQIPVTPYEGKDRYFTLVKEKEAEGKDWVSDTVGFLCTGAGDYVEVSVDADAWPSHLPKKVTCTSGKDKAVAKIKIRDDKLVPMFVGDGSLVLPRLRGETAHYEGSGPRNDLVVGLGKVEGLSAVCRVEQGSSLNITASGELDDGDGRCVFRTPNGEDIPVPFVVVTVTPQ